jgi:hypothetical protein
MSKIPIIGRGCRTDEHFTADIARVLGYPTLQRAPDATAEQFLIRRLEPLKFYSRPWANADLTHLTPAELDVAAAQIVNAAADAAQDRLCEPRWREKQGASMTRASAPYPCTEPTPAQRAYLDKLLQRSTPQDTRGFLLELFDCLSAGNRALLLDLARKRLDAAPPGAT